MIVRALLSRQTFYRTENWHESVDEEKKKRWKVRTKDERATALTLPIYRDWAFAIVVFQIAFAKGNFVRHLIMLLPPPMQRYLRVYGSGGLIRMDIETDNLYPPDIVSWV